jgi:hypothetical protein
MQNIATSYSRDTRQASGITHIARQAEKAARGEFLSHRAVPGEAKSYNARLSREPRHAEPQAIKLSGWKRRARRQTTGCCLKYH